MRRAAVLLAVALGASACERTAPPPPAPGIDAAQKVVTLGMLNDESGPAQTIGRAWAVGKRVLLRQVNEGGSGLLPDGWRLQYVERDAGYDPQRAQQLFAEVREQVLFLGTSFGTPVTLALRPQLERLRIVAFPASLSSRMHDSEFTPPLGPSCRVETLRALDWAFEQAGSRAARVGVIYQDDDYGQDGFAAAQAGAAQRGHALAAAVHYAAGQADYTPAVAAMRQAGATHVLLIGVPSATGPILGIAAQLDYHPVWIGGSPSWIDRFFDPTVVPPQLFANYHWVMSSAYWGENVPFMPGFLAAYEKYGRALAPPDFYILSSYAQGLLQLEVVRRMIASGELSREGFYRALRTLKGFDAQRVLPEAPDFTVFPYRSGSKARVLKPDFASRSWKVVGPFAAPALPAEAPAP